jgi:hypothetical protein
MPKCIGYVSDMHTHIHIMHIRAYPSMSAQMWILVWAIVARIWMSIGYCMTILCRICIKMNIWKKPNSRYDHMHIHVLSRFISGIFDISGQHWFIPTSLGKTIGANTSTRLRWKCQNWLNTNTKLVWKYSIQYTAGMWKGKY